MNRHLLKDESRKLVKTSTPKPVIAAVILLVILMLISLISTRLIVQPFAESITEAFPDMFSFSIFGGSDGETFNYYAGFDFTDPDAVDDFVDDFMDAMEAGMPSTGAWLINLLLGIIVLVLWLGFLIFSLNIAMGAEASYWNLLDGFPMILRLLWLEILKGLFVFLWSLLFIIPGIIAAYGFRQAEYLLVQHPEMSARDCLRESKKLMKGHKWELFVLDLSFIGWALLIGIVSTITIWGIPVVALAIRIWYIPFLYITRALYYKELTYVPPEEEWTPEF